MPIHPDARAYLDLRLTHGEQPYETLSVAEARAQSVRLSQLSGPGMPVAHVEDRLIPGPGGEMPVRIYTPAGDGPFPVLVYFHGGGWVVGNLETVDSLCRAATNVVPCIVVSVNYRHGPEHKFPAAADDAYAATVWVAQNATTFNGDPARLAVGGASAGANLAAVTCLRAREQGTPAIIFQLLTVPATNFSFDTVSHQENGTGYGLTRSVMEWFRDHYLNSPEDGLHPDASPLLAEDLSHLPPAFVMTAEFDPLRDEGEAYAERLRQAGVPVTCTRYEGMVHTFLGDAAALDALMQLRQAFGL